MPIIDDGERLDAGLKLDLLVEEQIVSEVKAVERPNPVYEAQLLTYLKLSGKQLGFLINLTCPGSKMGLDG
jgi:GxxExxY protein